MSRTSSEAPVRRREFERGGQPRVAPPSGHVFCVQRQHGLVWYAKCATLEQIRSRTMPPMAGTRAIVTDAVAEWLRHVEHDRGRKPTTVRGYQTLLRTHVLPEFKQMLLTDITTEHIERWVWSIDCSAATGAKLIVCLSGRSC
jgi:hypothetical protein